MYVSYTATRQHFDDVIMTYLNTVHCGASASELCGVLVLHRHHNSYTHVIYSMFSMYMCTTKRKLNLSFVQIYAAAIRVELPALSLSLRFINLSSLCSAVLWECRSSRKVWQWLVQVEVMENAVQLCNCLIGAVLVGVNTPWLSTLQLRKYDSCFVTRFGIKRYVHTKITVITVIYIAR